MELSIINLIVNILDWIKNVNLGFLLFIDLMMLLRFLYAL